MEDEVAPEFECSICMKLLFEPVSVPCGHTFCRSCLERSLDYRSLCAVCRAPVVAGQSVNILIRSVIAEKYPSALASRRRELEDEVRAGEQEADLLRRRETTPQGETTGDGVTLLPLLRCDQMPLPHCRLEMDLRSYAEVQMVEHALQGGRRLGALEKTANEFGVCLDIVNFERNRARVSLAGKFRFRLREAPHMREDGFELGRCEAFFDAPLELNELSWNEIEVEDVPRTASQIAKDALELLEGQLRSIGQGGRREFTEHLGDVPRGLTTSAGLERLSFFLLGAIVMEASTRSTWLQSDDTKGRLEVCCKVLEASKGRPMLNLPGATSWMSPGQSTMNSLAILLFVIALLLAKAFGLLDRLGGHHSHVIDYY
uniref:RING-type domain-containing protein n=1 Tax=Noctiluca scintillans TaxID=2966 RepID=A0A7S1A9D7_NOCSC